MYITPSTKFKNGAYFCLCAHVLQIIQKCAHTGVDIDTINYATKYTTKMKVKFTAPLKSSLMHFYLNQEHQNSSILLTIGYWRIFVFESVQFYLLVLTC